MKKYIVFFCFLILGTGMQSCGFLEDLFAKKEVKTREEKKEQEEKVVVRELEWEEVTKEGEVITTYPEREDLVKEKDIFDVLCLLPFQGDNKKRGRSLYAGLKMASAELNANVKLRITTFDAGRLDREPEILRKLLTSPEFDIIIAPYATRDVNQVADLSKGTGALVLSPWNTSASIDLFPGYVQLSPGIDAHLKAMTRYAEREFGANKTAVMGERKDASLIGSVQEMFSDIEVYYTSSDPRSDAERIRNWILSSGVQAIIIPSWRSADEAYFISLLSVINAVREDRNISVFVLTSWLNNDNIRFDQLGGLDLHFTISRYVDPERRSFKRFEEDFYRKYQYFADDDVFYGYDIFQITSGLLSRYGFEALKGIEYFDCTNCLFNYDFVNTVSESGQEYILNDYVDIIAVKDFKFQKVN